MRSQVAQLYAHLQRNGLAPIYFISGDEPLQKMEIEDAIRSFARDNGFEERIVLNVVPDFNWDSIQQAAVNLSLFSNKQLIELKLSSQKPGKEGGLAFVQYAENTSEDNVLVISADKIERKTQQTKWFNALEKTGVIIQVWPIGPAQLPDWIASRVRKQGKTISANAANLIAQRVEGNLLAAKQEIDKLCLLVDDDQIDTEQVVNAVTESTRYDVFSLIESAFSGQKERTLRILKGLQSEGVEPIALYGAIMWEFRRVCSMAYQIESGQTMEKVFSSFRVWDKRKSVTSKLLKRYNAAQLQGLLGKAIQLDRLIKSSNKLNIWDEFSFFLLQLAGARLPEQKIY